MTAKAALQLVASKLDDDDDAREALDVLRRRITPRRTTVSAAAKTVTKWCSRKPGFGLTSNFESWQRYAYLDAMVADIQDKDARAEARNKLEIRLAETPRSAQFDYVPPKGRLTDDQLRVYVGAIIEQTTPSTALELAA